MEINGQRFDSGAEAKDYEYLTMLEKAGKITDLKRQVKFILIPKQEGERECSYRADFTYQENGKMVVRDRKGFKTPDYVIKRKLMLHVHGIRILEV